MIYIKDHYPSDKFEAAFYSLFPALWIPPQSDLSEPTNLTVGPFSATINVRLKHSLQALLRKNFTSIQIDQIIAGAGTPEYKKKLVDITKAVVEKQGAFGCPWFWVTNGEGKGEPFFGSDRYIIPILNEAF